MTQKHKNHIPVNEFLIAMFFLSWELFRIIACYCEPILGIIHNTVPTQCLRDSDGKMSKHGYHYTTLYIQTRSISLSSSI